MTSGAATSASAVEWGKVLGLIPGYDPWATAGECTFDAAAADRAAGQVRRARRPGQPGRQIIPCRSLGDPLQAVLWTVRPGACTPWRDVVDAFGRPMELTERWRWRGRNEELGAWLAQTRTSLLEGRTVSLKSIPVHVKTIPGHQAQVALCRDLARRDGSIIALRRWPQMCHRIARDLRNLYVVMESVECEDLVKWCDRLGRSGGPDRVVVALDFVQTMTARLPVVVRDLRNSMAAGTKRAFKKRDHVRIAEAACRIGESDDVREVRTLLTTLASLDQKITYKRKELWDAMGEALRCYAPTNHANLTDAARSSRDRLRRTGWRAPYRCLSTPLRVKGLEFHHGLVLNLAELNDAEETYVALTRASDSLTVVTAKPTLQRPKPRYLAT